jgi:fluoroacetyl-CoA thioesterase
MQNKLKTGLKGYCELIVSKKDTALTYRSGAIEVFATPGLVALMENAAQTSVQRFLPDGSVSVGSGISVKHIKATGLEKKVWAESVLTSIDGRKLEFEITAWDEEGQIGHAAHTRYIVDEKKFMSNL